MQGTAVGSSLRTRILLLLLVTALVPLLVAGVLLDRYLHDLHEGFARQESQTAFQDLAANLRGQEAHLRKAAEELARSDSIIAPLSLLSRYQEPSDYRPLVLDGEKKKLARQLRQLVLSTPASRACIHLADGSPAAFAYPEADGSDIAMGIASYSDGEPTLLLSRNGERWQQGSFSDFPYRLRFRPMPAPFGTRYHTQALELRQTVSRPVDLDPADSRIQRVGSVRISASLDSGQLLQLAAAPGIHFGLFTHNGRRLIGPGDWRPTGLARGEAPPLFSGDSVFRGQGPNYLASIRALPPKGSSPLYLAALYDKTVLQQEIAGARQVIVAVLLGAGILVLPLSLLFVRRRITGPLGEVMAGVTAFRRGNYHHRIPDLGSDETGQLARAMNNMVEAVREREAELTKILAHMPAVLFLKDATNGRYVRINPAGAQLLGRTVEDILGRDDHELFSAEVADALVASDRKAVESGEMTEFPEETVETPQGPRIMLARKIPLPGPHGETAYILGTALDLTARRRNEERLRMAQEIAQMGPWEYHLAHDHLILGEETRRILGLAPDSHVTPDMLERVALPADQREVAKALQHALSAGQDLDTEFRLPGQPEPRVVHVRGRMERDSLGRPYRLLGMVQDVSHRRHMEEQQKLAATVFDSSSEGVLITDLTGHILTANPAFSQITGTPGPEVENQRPGAFIADGQDTPSCHEIWAEVGENDQWRGEVRVYRQDGETFPAWLTVSTVRGDQGQISHFVAVFSDITPLKEAEARLDYLAYHDPLTDLPNRLHLQQQLQQALEAAEQGELCTAVLFLDLDRFKTINDSLGHPTGDQLLRAVGARLREAIPAEDILARVGGDEFVVALQAPESEQAVSDVARRILASLSPAFEIQGHELSVDASIGISLYPDDGQDPATLIRNADAAMYRAKAAGANQFRFYTPDLTEEANHRLRLEMDLRQAVERDQLFLTYQPQVNLRTGAPLGLEALVRWQHPDLGLVSPGEFIPLAEETHLILNVGEWVLHRACREFQGLREAGLAPGRLAVNVSAVQIHHGNLIEQVSQALAESGLPPEALELEVTEAVFVSESTARTFHHLRELGIQLAIDDFGTGFSSLSYLRRMPVSRLKIDQSFVRHMLDDANDRAIVRSIVALGQSLAMDVIAEGVETEGMAEALVAEGCIEGQGFLYGRPLDRQQAAAWLRAEKGRPAEG